MMVVLSLAVGLFLILGLLTAFLRVEPASLASGIRTAGPLTLAILGIGMLLLGRIAPGGLMLAGALGWFLFGRRPKRRSKSPRAVQRPIVRTAVLEMELNGENGNLEGLVLAGRHEQRVLGTMNLPELMEVYADMRSDSESRQLLEAYLDGRFPVWRKDADTNRGDRKGIAPGAGPMTKQEAYKVLGLEAGATATDVRKAHRRLIQRLHPDVGGSSFLAARINEAKDVLLTNHN